MDEALANRTFAELGIPFPLFAGRVHGTEYVGHRSCSICSAQAHCFQLGIGRPVIATCPKCGTQIALDSAGRKDGVCRSCKASVPFPIAPERRDLCACYVCVRAGRVAFTKDTELGMIAWENTLTGLTNGVPGLDHPGFEIVPTGEDDWFAARLPVEWMFELLRTPEYGTWQGECWLFCCQRPMVFVGEWSQDDYTRRAPDGDGQAFFVDVIEDAEPEMWDGIGRSFGNYVFHCPECDRYRGHYDMD